VSIAHASGVETWTGDGTGAVQQSSDPEQLLGAYSLTPDGDCHSEAYSQCMAPRDNFRTFFGKTKPWRYVRILRTDPSVVVFSICEMATISFYLTFPSLI
jgi:hypothetical protein